MLLFSINTKALVAKQAFSSQSIPFFSKMATTYINLTVIESNIKSNRNYKSTGAARNSPRMRQDKIIQKTCLSLSQHNRGKQKSEIQGAHVTAENAH